MVINANTVNTGISVDVNLDLTANPDPISSS